MYFFTQAATLPCLMSTVLGDAESVTGPVGDTLMGAAGSRWPEPEALCSSKPTGGSALRPAARLARPGAREGSSPLEPFPERPQPASLPAQIESGQSCRHQTALASGSPQTAGGSFLQSPNPLRKERGTRRTRAGKDGGREGGKVGSVSGVRWVHFGGREGADPPANALGLWESTSCGRRYESTGPGEKIPR